MEIKQKPEIKSQPDFDPIVRKATAIDYFKQGYNCSQAVIATYSDIIGIPFDKAIMIGANGVLMSLMSM